MSEEMTGTRRGGLVTRKNGQKKNISLRQIAQKVWTEDVLVEFLEHVRLNALEHNSASVRWAQLFVDILEGNDRLKIQVDVSRWDAWQQDLVSTMLGTADQDILSAAMDYVASAEPGRSTELLGIIDGEARTIS